MPRPIKDFPLTFRREIEKRLKSLDRDQRNLLTLIRAFTYLSDDYVTFGQELQALERRFPEMGETKKNPGSRLTAPFSDQKGSKRQTRARR